MVHNYTMDTKDIKIVNQYLSFQDALELLNLEKPVLLQKLLDEEKIYSIKLNDKEYILHSSILAYKNSEAVGEADYPTIPLDAITTLEQKAEQLRDDIVIKWQNKKYGKMQKNTSLYRIKEANSLVDKINTTEHTRLKEIYIEQLEKMLKAVASNS